MNNPTEHTCIDEHCPCIYSLGKPEKEQECQCFCHDKPQEYPLAGCPINCPHCEHCKPEEEYEPIEMYNPFTGKQGLIKPHIEEQMEKEPRTIITITPEAAKELGIEHLVTKLQEQ